MRTRVAVLGIVVAAWLAAWGGEAKFKVADMAVVKSDKAEVRQGTRVLATLTKGQRVKIHWVHEEGGWALVYITLQGKPVRGYVRLSDLEPPARKDGKLLGTGFVADDEVIVVVPQAKLMMGKDVLGRVPKGTKLTVRKVEPDWVGVYADIEGKKTFGWIRTTDLDYAPIDEKPGDVKEGEEKDRPKDTPADQPKEEPKEGPKEEPKDKPGEEPKGEEPEK